MTRSGESLSGAGDSRLLLRFLHARVSENRSVSARRPSAPRSSRAPAGRTDRPSATPKTKKPSASARAAGVQFTTNGDRTVSISWRLLVGVLVAAMAFVLVAPTLNLYFQQMEQVRTLNEQIEAAKERNAQLEREIALWDDADFVRSQARERLGYVLPGEQPWVVVDPEAIIGEEAQQEYQEQMGYVAPLGPWYLEMWTSVETAGATDLVPSGRLLGDVERPEPDEPEED